MKRRPNRSLSSPWPAVPIAMPKIAALPMKANSAGEAKDLVMNGLSEPKIVKSITSKK